jgi:tRNA (guanine37-N1)-methyltransferase
MLKLDIIALFPQLFQTHLENLPFKRAILNKLLEVQLHDLRKQALDSYGTVDDKPYGGGVGMILMVEPIYKSLSESLGVDFDKVGSIKSPEYKKQNGRVIVLSPRGKTFNQQIAQDLALETHVTLICGRYEGIDARVEENYATDVLSIGNYVLSGGELPALVIAEAVTRLLPGVLQKEGATETESFSMGEEIEYPQYTRPEDFKGFKVPEVLLSGNHSEIEKWRKEKSRQDKV